MMLGQVAAQLADTMDDTARLSGAKCLEGMCLLKTSEWQRQVQEWSSNSDPEGADKELRLPRTNVLPGAAATWKGTVRLALACFRRQLRCSMETSDSIGRTQALDGMTECFARLGDLVRAAATAQACCELMRSLGDAAGEIAMRLRCGPLLDGLKGRGQDARENYQRVVELAATVGDVEAGRRASFLLSGSLSRID